MSVAVSACTAVRLTAASRHGATTAAGCVTAIGVRTCRLTTLAAVAVHTDFVNNFGDSINAFCGLKTTCFCAVLANIAAKQDDALVDFHVEGEVLELARFATFIQSRDDLFGDFRSPPQAVAGPRVANAAIAIPKYLRCIEMPPYSPKSLSA